MSSLSGSRRRARSEFASCCRKRRGASRTTRASTGSCARPLVSICRSMSCSGAIWTSAARSIDRHPDTRFIIDHLGIVQPRVPPASPEPWADLPKVLELARRPNAVIKVSGACTLSRQPYPFPDIWDPLARVFDAWGFDRCLWGTDWTRAFAVVNFEQAVEPFLRTDRLKRHRAGDADGRGVCQGYGWSPRKVRAPRCKLIAGDPGAGSSCSRKVRSIRPEFSHSHAAPREDCIGAAAAGVDRRHRRRVVDLFRPRAAIGCANLPGVQIKRLLELRRILRRTSRSLWCRRSSMNWN